MKRILTILFLLVISTIYGQKIVINATDKLEQSKENTAFDYRIIKPKTDTLNLTKEKVFTLIIGHSGEMNSLHLIDYPIETYADLNGIERPETNEEFLALSDEEQDKLTVIIPKHEIKKEVFLSRKKILEIEITSDRSTHTEIYADGKLIKTLYYLIE